MFIMPILIFNMLYAVPEHPVKEQNTSRLSLRDSFRYVWANEPYRILVIIFLFSTIGSAMTNSLSFFFVKHVLLAGDLYGFYLAPILFRKLSPFRCGSSSRLKSASIGRPWSRFSGMPCGLASFR